MLNIIYYFLFIIYGIELFLIMVNSFRYIWGENFFKGF